MGFAHGTAGIGYAFSQLFNITREEKFKDACLKAFRFEDQFYNAQWSNWQILGAINSEDPFVIHHARYQSKWCHGAAGIGLSRIAGYIHTNDLQALQMIHSACRAAINAEPVTNNYSLCHGHLSNAELLLHAGSFLMMLFISTRV
ncbi:MAG: hypothetical protein IPP71_07820 [Bacteroidetes bacterium]|nr:hypothetical protein [Bacteroidota bacterium]